MTSQIAPHVWFPEPKLSFHPERASDTDAHPLRGLLRFGPHSSGLVPDPIRVATIAPVGEGHRLYSFMKELNSEYDPSDARITSPNGQDLAACSASTCGERQDHARSSRRSP